MSQAAPSSRNGPQDVWTVQRILEWTTKYLKEHHSETPRLDAEILLAHTRKCQRIQLYTQFDAPLTDDERAQMRDLVKRRAQAEPVAYLVGHREFFSLDFAVSKAVLIPRPDTETLVLELIERAKSFPQPRILELCTGSGCIAVSAAVNLETARVVATDVSPGALSVAAQNVATHKLQERIELREGDLWNPLQPGEQFDFIASNPPYIPEAEIAELDADVRLHEPHLALAAGPDGMQFLLPIIERAAEFLAPGGWLLLETGVEQSPLTFTAIEKTGQFAELQVIRDLAQRPRVIVARR